MESRVRGEAVVAVFYGLYGNLDLEVSAEHEVLEFQHLVVFLDGFGPYGLAELDSACGDFYR